MRIVYRAGFRLALTLLGKRTVRDGVRGAVESAIDDAFGTRGSPAARRQVTNVGALTPMVMSLAPAIPLLLSYPLHEVRLVLRAVWILVAVCVSFALVQFVHHIAAVRDEARWTQSGRPDAWVPARLARPNGLDTLPWALLAFFLIAVGP